MRQRKTSKKMAAYIAAMAMCLGMAQNADAQNITVTVPVSSHFVKVTAEGVNVRRLPNTTSGKIMLWNSDAGSIDTYCKIFYSDTEANLYKANRNTGAYIDAFHPYVDDCMVVASSNPTPVNGWYNVIANAPEYAGAPGRGNSRLGWIKADFCKAIDMTDNTNGAFSYPIDVKWDSKKESYIFGKAANTNGGGFKRGTGKFAKLTLQADADEENNTLQLYTAAFFSGYRLVAECNIEIIHDPDMTSNYAMEQTENDMGDPAGLAIKVKSNKNMIHSALFYLMKCPDSVFQQVMDEMFPEGKFPTDKVYIVNKSGNMECINFKTYKVGNEFKSFTLRTNQ